MTLGTVPTFTLSHEAAAAAALLNLPVCATTGGPGGNTDCAESDSLSGALPTRHVRYNRFDRKLKK